MLNSMTRNEARAEALERQKDVLKDELSLLLREQARQCGEYEDFFNEKYMEFERKIADVLWKLDGLREAE